MAWGTTYGSPPSGAGFTAIEAAFRSGYALAADGSIAAWGDDTFGIVSNIPGGGGFSGLEASWRQAYALRTEFTAGDRLQGSLDAIGQVKTAGFEGLEGMTLKLKFPKSSAMKSRVTVRDDLGAVVAEWTVNHGKKTKKAAKLTRTGAHSLSVEALSGTPGPFEIATKRKLPPAARPSSTAAKGSGDPKEASFTMVALPGASLEAVFLPKNGFTGPMTLDVTQPDGAALAITTHALENGGLSVDAIVVTDAGPYVFTVSGFAKKKEKVKAKLLPQQPPAGNGTVTFL